MNSLSIRLGLYQASETREKIRNPSHDECGCGVGFNKEEARLRRDTRIWNGLLTSDERVSRCIEVFHNNYLCWR